MSCPIACYSQITVQLCSDARIVAPPGHFKAAQAARLGLDTLGRPDLGAIISLDSPLPPGRGLASSTADIVGVLVGLATALNRSLPAAALACLACQIEPSDSTMFNGLALLAYRGSSRHVELGAAPTLPLLMLDPGTAVDTVSYNARLDLAAVQNLAVTTQTAVELLTQGLRRHEAEAIGAATTLSAISYQKVSFSPLIEQAQSWAKTTGALGLVRAHSGSVAGLLYPPQTDLSDLFRWLAHRFTGVITETRLVNGGYRVAGIEVQSLVIAPTLQASHI
ncbi:MAG: hypothetical protein U0401_13450 [Anaerolineae bacterium]